MRLLRVVCGSSSRQRQQILRECPGLSVELCLPADIDERAAIGDAVDPEEIVICITKAKTDRCLHLLKDHDCAEFDVLVTGDIVVLDAAGRILEKPISTDDAKDMLSTYNRDRLFYSVQALEVTNLKTGERALGTDWVSGRMRDPLPEAEFDDYLATSGAMAAAGAMIVEFPWFFSRVDWIRGEILSIRGLSLKLLKALLYDVSRKSLFLD
eukprot:Protomagalhaensia_wolfi_Nauph_80__333@NODE_1186_length_1669_cov_173_673620_g910_i0_p3_GENE_NODE_1186_length_1669_cov_173_673620_g910_i0NODE_1186_length_1669_cov_173_673620_g910_i0_p3_ORF_typecomplete_len211_score36_99Maf/PF02545_14/4_1e26_NODE_1186_length_1669_cov_173_673620_g910_i08781510